MPSRSVQSRGRRTLDTSRHCHTGKACTRANGGEKNQGEQNRPENVAVLRENEVRSSNRCSTRDERLLGPSRTVGSVRALPLPTLSLRQPPASCLGGGGFQGPPRHRRDVCP